MTEASDEVAKIYLKYQGKLLGPDLKDLAAPDQFQSAAGGQKYLDSQLADRRIDELFRASNLASNSAEIRHTPNPLPVYAGDTKVHEALRLIEDLKANLESFHALGGDPTDRFLEERRSEMLKTNLTYGKLPDLARLKQARRDLDHKAHMLPIYRTESNSGRGTTRHLFMDDIEFDSISKKLLVGGVRRSLLKEKHRLENMEEFKRPMKELKFIYQKDIRLIEESPHMRRKSNSKTLTSKFFSRLYLASLPAAKDPGDSDSSDEQLTQKSTTLRRIVPSPRSASPDGRERVRKPSLLRDIQLKALRDDDVALSYSKDEGHATSRQQIPELDEFISIQGMENDFGSINTLQ